MGITITGGDGFVGTVSASVFLYGPADNPMLITTGAEGAVGTIVGATYGIVGTTNANWTVTNHGTVIGSTLSGIIFNDGGTVTNTGGASLVQGAGHGISITGVGTVNNSGSVSGLGIAGVVIEGDNAVVSNGAGGYTNAAITGNVYGVLLHGANATVTNAGTISGGFYTGVQMSQGGTISNGGAGDSGAIIVGNGSGVVVYGAAGLLFNDGTITGTNGGGVIMQTGGSVTNGADNGTVALISGVYSGVEISNFAGTVANDGSIHASDFFGVLLRAGGSVTNGSTADSMAPIYGGSSGVVIGSGGGTVVNFATIVGGSDAGVRLDQGGSVNNAGAAASIYGGTYGVNISIAAGTITNAGSISGFAAGVRLLVAGGSLDNQGLIGSGAGDAVRMGDNARITNGSPTNPAATLVAPNGDTNVHFAITVAGRGDITSYGTIIADNTASHVIELAAGGIVRNLGTASRIAGGALGIGAGGAATIINEGTINSAEAIALSDGGRLANSGTISAAGNAIIASGRRAAVTNTGTISGGDTGINLQAGGILRNGPPGDHSALVYGYAVGLVASRRATVINNGAIASYGEAVQMFAGGTITNNHLISGDLVGIRIANGTVVNNGYIAGNSAIVALGTSASTVINKGFISAPLGDAVHFANAEGNVFALNRNAGFSGNVVGGNLTDTIRLTGTAAGKGLISDIGTTFQNFERVDVRDGEVWQVAGRNVLPSNSTISLDGALEVTGTLTALGNLTMVNPGSPGMLHSLDVAPGGAIEIGTAGLATPGRIVIDTDGHLVATGRIAGRVTAGGTQPTMVVNNGRITSAADGDLFIQGRVIGSGTIELGTNSTMFIGATTSIRHFLFASGGGDETLSMTANPAVLPRVVGFADNDAIDLFGFIADPALTTFAAHVLTLHEAGGPGSLALHFLGAGYHLSNFAVAPGGFGDTVITHI